MNKTAPFLAGATLALGLLHAQGPDDAATRRPLPPAPPMADVAEPTTPVQNGTRMASLRTPIHTAPADRGQSYGVWAAGDDYKVSFHGGMTFVPYLGAGYPTTQMLQWRTTSARQGTHELIENPTPQPVQVGDFRFEYRFGAVTEAYDVLAGGLEQTFVVHQRPTQGDLVIRGAVQSLLRSRNVAAAHQPLTFADAEGRAIVGYGRSVAFDANGDRVEVTTSYTDGEIALTVPANWVARATLPITVDPLLTRVSVATWGTPTDGEVETVDIGRDDEAVTDNVMVAYTRAASATDFDAWARLGDDDFTGASVVFSDITTSWSTTQTACAFVGGADRWAVLLRRYFGGLSPAVSELRCHVHASGDTTLATNYGSLNPPANHNDWRVDVGGVQGFSSGSNALVVFQREDNTPTSGGFANAATSEIHGSILDVTTTNGTFGATFAIKPSATHDNERPSVNQVSEGGVSHSWVCIYQRYVDGGGATEDWDLNGARIDQNGAVASGTWISDLANVTPAQHQLGPVVEGNGGRYCVVFNTVDVASVAFKTGLIAGKQVHAERFDWAHGTSTPSADRPNVLLRSNTDRRWEATGIGYDSDDRSHWAVAFRAIPPGSPSLYYARLGYNGEPTEGPIGTLLYNVSSEQPIGGACVFDNDADAFLFSYGVAIPTTQPVYGHALTYTAAAAPATFGVSCSNAGLVWLGNQQIGAEFNSINVTGAPASAIHLMLVATVTTNVPVIHPVVFPGCRLFVMASGPGYLGTFPAAVGSSASWNLALPEFVGAQTLYFQDWYLDATNLLYSTERIAVEIVK